MLKIVTSSLGCVMVVLGVFVFGNSLTYNLLDEFEILTWHSCAWPHTSAQNNISEITSKHNSLLQSQPCFAWCRQWNLAATIFIFWRYLQHFARLILTAIVFKTIEKFGWKLMVAYLAANPASCMLAIAVWIHKLSLFYSSSPSSLISSFISLPFFFTALDHTNLVATILVLALRMTC